MNDLLIRILHRLKGNNHMKYPKMLLISVFVLLLALPAAAQEATPEADASIGFAEALLIAQEWGGDAYVVVEVDTEDDDNDVRYWEVTLYALNADDANTDTGFLEIYIDMMTGEVLEAIQDDDAAMDDDDDADDDDLDDGGAVIYDDLDDPTVIEGILISIEEAITEAQRIYPDRDVIGLELEDDEGVLTWVVIFAAVGEEGTREVEISTQTGNVLGFGFDADYEGDDDRWDDDDDAGRDDNDDDNDDAGRDDNDDAGRNDSGNTGSNDNDDDNDDAGRDDNDDDNDDAGDDNDDDNDDAGDDNDDDNDD